VVLMNALHSRLCSWSIARIHSGGSTRVRPGS